MKPKLLTRRQQMGIFNTQNPVEVMREYDEDEIKKLYAALRDEV